MKLQYTHNFGSSAFVRVYGYTYYSDWLQNGPQGLYADYAGCCSADYELTSHTRGGSIQFQDQINAQNLVSVSEDYTTANSVRDNNSFYFVGAAAVVVNAAAPTSGYCYGPTGGAPINCHGNVTSFGTIQSQGAAAASRRVSEPRSRHDAVRVHAGRERQPCHVQPGRTAVLGEFADG